MKFIFMLLALFVLTDPVLAKPANSSSDCLNMYLTYMNDYGASEFIPREKMLKFIDWCVPANLNNDAAYSNTQQDQRLLRNIEYGERIITYKT